MANDTHHRHTSMGMCPCCRALPPALLCITFPSAGSREQREVVAVALLGAARVALGMRNVVGRLFPWCQQPGSAVLPQRPGRPLQCTLCMCIQQPDGPVQPVSEYGK